MSQVHIFKAKITSHLATHPLRSYKYMIKAIRHKEPMLHKAYMLVTCDIQTDKQTQSCLPRKLDNHTHLDTWLSSSNAQNAWKLTGHSATCSTHTESRVLVSPHPQVMPAAPAHTPPPTKPSHLDTHDSTVGHALTLTHKHKPPPRYF